MPIGLSDIIRVGNVWVFAGVAEMINVLHIKITGFVAQTEGQVQSDIEDYLLAMYTPLATWFDDSLVHNRIEMFNVTDQASMSPLGANALMDGGNAGETLPTQVAAEVFYRTATPRHIGRTFLPVMTEAANANGSVAAALQGDLATFAQEFSTEFTGTNGVVLRGVVYDRSAGLSRDITSYGVPTFFRTQRRRRIGVGR